MDNVAGVAAGCKKGKGASIHKRLRGIPVGLLVARGAPRVIQQTYVGAGARVFGESPSNTTSMEFVSTLLLSCSFRIAGWCAVVFKVLLVYRIFLFVLCGGSNIIYRAVFCQFLCTFAEKTLVLCFLSSVLSQNRNRLIAPIFKSGVLLLFMRKRERSFSGC